MGMSVESASEIARKHFGSTDRPVALGWGISGFVFLSPDTHTAVKIHSTAEGFATELQVYRKLGTLGIDELHGLNVPMMRDWRSDLRLIRMDVVSAPYLLDFAGVMFDPPDFDEDRWAYWRETISGFYGPNDWVAYDVYRTLAGHGLYYVDFRPSNMNIEGLPGLLPHDPPTWEDL